jgi:hypothetical protein
MRITAFRAWVGATLNQGLGAARRAGLAIARKIRPSSDTVEPGAGIGDDEEGGFRGRGSRAWIEILEEVRRRLEQLFGKSTFERFPRMERFFRRFLGAPSRDSLPSPKPRPRAEPTAASRPAATLSRVEAERVRAQIRMAMIEANTRGTSRPVAPSSASKAHSAASKPSSRPSEAPAEHRPSRDPDDTESD